MKERFYNVAMLYCIAIFIYKEKYETGKIKPLSNRYEVHKEFYSTRVFYQDYIRGKFTEYPLWIRNVHWSPQIDMRDLWTFWQYTDRAVMNGYQGEEKYIDRNVFAGSRKELEEYLVKSVILR